ncbi:transcription antitermination factor NusB [Gloeocapsa sp. PCC 73106]|uniref:transcription antitermination factor NusB n=1 Tax=Gloeocapsa sp. PCC 73106 TaxID=102232 RepID=UPI0002AC754F|nr:transcription antitermination factor NusB [Gloeocapsa sp. PCC 73106]ELR96627.1 NusB antitermination factor [Gloeocapsa sp. PCC 73106]
MSILQPRRIAREIALLSLSQVQGKMETLEQEELGNLLLEAIRTLSSVIRSDLETASAEVQRANERLLSSETRSSTITSARTMLQEALELTQSSINRLGYAVELPEFMQLVDQAQVREYALTLIGTVKRRNKEIEENIENVLSDWHFSRIAKLDQDILKIAVAEILYLDIPHKVAINEAVEIAKRYSDPEGYRFINGVLRKVTNALK